MKPNAFPLPPERHESFTGKMTILLDDWLQDAVVRLQPVTTIANLEAQVMAAHVLAKSRSWILANLDLTIPRTHLAVLNELIEKRTAGQPLPYLIGHWEFFGLDLLVTPDVLIPRAETELLVEQALKMLSFKPNARIADVGTGSGCIAIAIAMNSNVKLVCATDISMTALGVCQQNRKRYSLQQKIALLQCDLLSSISTQFDLLCANLPYIPTKKLIDLSVSHHEPGLALDGGVDGLDFIGKLFQQSATCLKPDGAILLEIEETNADASVKIARHHFPDGLIMVLPDLAGRPRLLQVNLGE